MGIAAACHEMVLLCSLQLHSSNYFPPYHRVLLRIGPLQSERERVRETFTSPFSQHGLMRDVFIVIAECAQDHDHELHIRVQIA